MRTSTILHLFFLLFFINVNAFSAEDCSNGIDDDNDGLIDCGDTDCYGDNACVDAFECTNTLFQVISKTLKELNVATSSYDDIGVASASYNGGGFNFQDGYIYGINKNEAARNLWKIDNSGREENLGPIANFGGINYAGDFDQDGKLYTYKSGSYPVLYYVDVDQLPLEHVAQNLTNNYGSSIPGAADITYNPITEKLYGLSSKRQIIIIDPINLTIDLDLTLTNAQSTSGAFGAAYSDSEGNSYFSNNTDGKIYKLSFNNDGDPIGLTHVANGAPTNSNDGMACSNSLPPFETDCGDGIDNDGDGLIDCDDPDCFVDSDCPRLTATLECVEETGPNGIIPFHLRLINDSQADALDFTITDVLPDGFSMLYDTITLSGTASQTDVLDRPDFGKTDTVSWSTLNIPVGDTLEISYSLLVSETADEGVYQNSVFAENVLMNPNTISHEILVSNYIIEEKQTLSCKPAFYQVYKKRGEPNIYAKLNVETGDYQEIAPISHQANGLGFDYQTGLAYGAEGRLFISIDSNGVVESYGQPFNRKVFVGDTDTLGNWWGKDGNDMVKIQIASMLDRNIPDITERFAGKGMPGWDMAYNKDGNFYAVHNTTLYKFDPSNQSSTTVGTLIGDAVPNSGHGAQWTGSDGRLYISNNSTGKIFRVDVTTREAKLMMQSISGLRFNDGFSCPLELPAPLTFDHHDYSGFPAASIFTYSQNTDGVPDLEAVWAGSGIDYETESLAFTTAESDSYDDGLSYTTYLPPSTLATWEVNLNTSFSSSKDVYYGVWIDWDADNSVDSFYNGSATMITAQTNVPLQVNVPANYVDTTIAVRLIVSERALIESDIDLYEDDVTGEVEDYRFFGNTMVDCGNGLDDDNDGLVDCDDPDCYDNCKYTTTKSGFEGGLESNNRLSHKVNLVNYNKKAGKYGRQARRSAQRKINKAEFKKSLKSYNKSNTSVQAYMPIDVIPNTESRVSSPDHLVKITNATELYAIDIYEGNDRKGAVLGLKSADGVYEHTKYVCDRLAGSKIVDILTYHVKLVEAGVDADTFELDLIIPKMELEDGLIEYAVSFSVRDTTIDEADEFIFESHWNLDDYTKNEAYMNFQIWASSVKDLEILLAQIFKNLTDQNKHGRNISTFIIGTPPVFYINEAQYVEDMLHLEITNKSGLTSVNLTGEKSFTETDAQQDLDMVLNLNGQENQSVSIDLGRLYDMGVTFYHESLNAHDVIFLSDGSWNTAYEGSDDVVDAFTSNQGSNFSEENYEMDRNVQVSGVVKNYINLYRSFNPNFVGVDVDSFENLNFTISGNGTIEVSVLKESIESFADQGKYLLELTEEPMTYSLSKKHFVNDSDLSQDWSDIFMVQFTIVGDGFNENDFEINISDLYWGPNQLSQDFMVFTPKGIIDDVDNNHNANDADGTDIGDVVLNADYSGDSLLISIDNLGNTELSIEDAFIDAIEEHFVLLDFEPTVLLAGQMLTLVLQYDPKETPMTSNADLRITIDGDDSYVISLSGGSTCPMTDFIRTSAIDKEQLNADKEYKAIESINSDAQIDNRNIVFKAGQTVVLDLGFEITDNSTFEVMIEDACSID